MKSYLIVIVILFAQALSAQQFIKVSEIGSFKQAAAFSLNPSGYIFVTDSETNELYKLDTLGNRLKSVGGYGWNPEAFDNPVEVFATTLNVYVADKNNDRIQIFDKDLNFLSVFKTKEVERAEYEFAYPTSCGVSPQGDLFVLDSDNSRILKYDLSGNFLTEIGSYDAGSFALSNPKKFDIGIDGKLFVLDDEAIKVFDSFGNGVAKLSPHINAFNLNIQYKYLTVNNAGTILIKNVAQTDKIMKFEPGVPEDIVESIYIGERLFILTATEIVIFKQVSK